MESRHNTTQNEPIVHATPDTITCARALILLLFAAMLVCGTASAIPTCTCNVTQNKDIEANSTGTFTALINCSDTGGINTSRFFMMNTVAAGMTWEPPNRWSIRPPVNNLAQSNGTFPQILRSYNRGKGAWYDNYGIFTDTDYPSRYANFSSDHFSYGVFDNTSIHVTITNGTDWAELNYTWNVEPTAFRNAMFLNLKQLETETKKEYKIYNSNPLLAKFWDVEHMGGTDNYTVCMFNNINYSGSPTENLKLYYCNGSYRTVSEQLPNNGSSDATANMTRNLLLLHFNNESAYGENGTHVYDFSGNGNNGTVIGNAVWSSSAGEFDGAYTFDGIDDYIETRDISHITGSNPMAIEFWFKTTFNSETQPIIDAGVVNIADKSLEFWLTAENQVGLGNNPPINTPGLYWGFWHNDIYIPSVNYYDGNWHHVVVTLYNNTTVEISYDGTRPAGYIWDGIKETWTYSSQPFTLPQKPNITTMPFWIGHSRLQFWTKGNTYFNGTIDEVAVYNRSLSTKEITEHYARGVIKPVDSPDCVYLGSLSTTDLDDIDYDSRNSSYSKFCFGVNNSKIGGINTTDTFYIACESTTTMGNYTVRYANGSSGTNVSFNDSKVAWSSTNNVTNWTQAKFTPDLWFASIKSGDIFQLGVYVENNTGRDGNYTNFTLYTDDIGDVNYPITNPSIAWYHSASGGTDSDLDGTHSGNMTIRVEMAEDPNKEGTVKHNLTLRHTDGSWCYPINESFYSPDDSDVDIVFDTENVLNGVYKMNVTAVADDNSSDVTSFLTPANFTIDNPTYVNTTGWWRCGAAFNASSIPITSAVENATSGERICVLNGNYYNESVNVNRSLTLYAKNPYGVNVSAPEPGPMGANHVFNVSADYVSITGFNVTGATGDDMAGFYLCNADNCNILNNMLSGNTWDIRIENSASVFESNRLNNTTISFTCGGNVSLKGAGMPADDPPRWNDINRFINATNQSVGAWLFLNFSYYESDVSGLNESDLTIWKYTGTAWVGVGEVYVDSGYNIIGANITNFCPIVPGTVPPNITSWRNNKTKDNTRDITVNKSEVVYFNATANQTITTWHWYNNTAVLSNNFDNYTTSWSVNGKKNILVNGTNANGTTNTVNWTITVVDYTTPPGQVTNLTNSTPTAHTVNLSWDQNPESDVAGYDVYRNGTWIGNTTNTTYNVTGLDPSTPYEFNVSAYDTNENNGENASIDVTTAAYPAPPNITSWRNNKTNNDTLYLTINESEVVYFNATANQTVTWHWYNNGPVPSNDFDNYTTHWSVNGTKNILVNGTNANGTTNTVNWTITVVDYTTPPGQVTNLTNSTPTAHTVNLSWDQNPESDVAGYDVYRNGTWIGNTTNTTYNVTGLDPSTPYEFNVSAYDTNENNGENASIDVTTAAYPAPPNITSWRNNKTKDNTRDITVNKSEVVYFNATANQTITTWHWYNNTAVLSNNFDNYTTSWSVNGKKNILVNGTNANGTTNTVNWTITVVDYTTPPGQVTNLTNSTPTAHTVNLSWDQNPESDVAGYDVYRNGTWIGNTTNTTYNVTGLDPSTPYEFNVSAYDTNENNGENASIDVTTAAYPAPPNITSWRNNKTNNDTLYLTINESEVVYFNATANQTVTWHWYNNGPVPSNDFDNYTTHWSVNGKKNILVNGTNANGTTNTVNWTITVVDYTTPPGQVTNLTNSTPTAHTVNLSWDQNPESDVAGYDVYRNGTWIGNTTNTTYNVTGLDPSTPYEFNVSAYDTNENNGENATVDVTTAPLTFACACDICVNTGGWWRDGAAFNASGTAIQHAINNATDGNTICVAAGTYHEDVNVSKRLTLAGEGADVVNVTNRTAGSHVFDVTADYVNISGFNVTGATGTDKAGIYLNGRQHCNISNNNASNNYGGIVLVSSSNNNTLTSNTASDNTWWDIYITDSSSTFTDNTLNGTTVSFTYGGNVSLKGVGLPEAAPSGRHSIGKFINATNQSVGAWLYLNFSYSNADVSGLDEPNLKVWKYNGTEWLEDGWNGARYLSTANNVVGVNITNFSIFAPMAPAAAGGNGGGGSGGEGTYPPGWFETPTPTPTQAAIPGSSSESTLPPSSGERVMPGENVTPTPTPTAEPAAAVSSPAEGMAAKSKNTWLWWLIAILALVAIAVIVYMMQRKEEK